MTTTEPQLADHALDDAERESIWQHGWATGRDAALALRPPQHLWAPLPITWAHVLVGDTFLGDDGTLWHVQALDRTAYPDEDAGTVEVVAVCGAQTFAVAVHRDEPVTVLDPVAERDALTLTAEVLGGAMISRRKGADVTG